MRRAGAGDCIGAAQVTDTPFINPVRPTVETKDNPSQGFRRHLSPGVCLLAAWVSLLGAGPVTAHAADPVSVTLVKASDRVRVEIGGQLFTEYIFGDGASRSYFYPVLAPDGTPLTRNFPMKQTPGEETDHPWHRSMWFAHSIVNGVDFWNEKGGDPGNSPDEKGHTVVDGAVETSDGAVGVIRVRDNWVTPAGKLICTDDRTIGFHADASGRFIDFEITLHALPDTPLVIGDNKDGTMAVRLAEWMTMTHKVKGVDTGGSGHVVTAKGDSDAAAWGKRADWCDYYSQRNGTTYGVAIFDNPGNIRHPTWWMARPYGLFGANPFGQHDYENLKDQPHAGDYTIPAGGSLTLRYRFYFHTGDTAAADIAGHYSEYAGGH